MTIWNGSLFSGRPHKGNQNALGCLNNPPAAPEGSYLARASKNLSSEDDASKHKSENQCHVSHATIFERDHFHSLNRMPTHPCTAFFNLRDHSTSTKEIFDGLLCDGIPAIVVHCLQRLGNDAVLITFSSEQYRNQLLHKSTLIIHCHHHITHPTTRQITYVNVYDAPHKLKDSTIEHSLGDYGVCEKFLCLCNMGQGFGNLIIPYLLIRSAIDSFLAFEHAFPSIFEFWENLKEHLKQISIEFSRSTARERAHE